jgi:ABC-2 type transport system permease protein
MSRLMEDVRQGTLDFTLTKPEDAQVLVTVKQVQIWKLIDVALGLALVAVALVRLGAEIGALQALAFGVALLAGAAMVYSVWLMLATLTFWFVRLENILVIFMAMWEAGRWPVGIYPPWLRATLTFVVPVAFATTVPAEALAGRLTAETLAGAVGLGALLLALSRWFWRFGVRHYSGASA